MSETVSREEFELVVKALSLRVQSLSEIITITLASLQAEGVITQDHFRKIIDRGRQSATSEALLRARNELDRYEAIRSILKETEGPLQ